MEGREFVLRRENGSRFHSLGAEKWNAREPIIVLYHGSAIDVCLMIADNEEGCKALEEHADN